MLAIDLNTQFIDWMKEQEIKIKSSFDLNLM